MHFLFSRVLLKITLKIDKTFTHVLSRSVKISEKYKQRLYVTDQLIIALDQGTTSSRAVLFDHNGDIVDVANSKYCKAWLQITN